MHKPTLALCLFLGLPGCCGGKTAPSGAAGSTSAPEVQSGPSRPAAGQQGFVYCLDSKGEQMPSPVFPSAALLDKFTPAAAQGNRQEMDRASPLRWGAGTRISVREVGKDAVKVVADDTDLKGREGYVFPSCVALQRTPDNKQARSPMRRPETACDLLKDEGFPTNGYVNSSFEYQGFSCGSGDRPFGASKDLVPKSLVVFGALGNAYEVDRLQLLSNADKPGQQPAALKKMAELAALLLKKTDGGELPDAAAKAIAAGKPGTWNTGSRKVTMTTTDGLLEALIAWP